MAGGAIDPIAYQSQALQLQAERGRVIASNIANADTPNYKARDIDFKTALAAASGESGSTSTLALRPTVAAGSTGAGPSAGASGALPADSASGIDPSSLKYRVPMAPSLDGNTVDEQLEQSAFAENTVRYQASLTFLNSALRDLMTAIVGS